MKRESQNNSLKVYALTFVILITFCVPVWAKNLFVSPTGDDAVSYDSNSSAYPWRTPQKAWYNARSGDTVYFRGGTYIISTLIDTRSYGYSGTQSSPITFTNYPGESVTMTGSSSLDPVIRIEKDWNIIRGINFNCAKSFFMFSYDGTVNGGTVENCVCNIIAGGDNSGFVYVNHNASNITIKNCKVNGPGAVGPPLNAACLIAFNVVNLKILNCELSNAPVGIYYKHGHILTSNTGTEIAYNYIHDTGRFSMFFNCSYAYIHDNLIGSNNAGIAFRESNGGPGGTNNVFSHNTIYSGSGNLTVGTDDAYATNNTVMNNIIMIPSQIDPYYDSNMSTTMNYNIYRSTGSFYHNRSTAWSISTWRSHFAQDSSSSVGVPIFVGGSSPASISGYALASGSLGKVAASDGKDIGADISKVGVSGSSTLAAPSGVSVQLIN